MQKIITTSNYTVRAEIHKIAIADYFWLQINSTLSTAKIPEEKHEMLNLILSRRELRKLRSIINLSLVKTV